MEYIYLYWIKLALAFAQGHTYSINGYDHTWNILQVSTKSSWVQGHMPQDNFLSP